MGAATHRCIESMADTIDGTEDFPFDVDSRWLRLFCDTPQADRFQRLDMAEIRTREYSAATPPPGTSTYWDAQEEEHDLPEKSWTCDMIDEANPGMTCGAVFASHRALAMHRRRAHNWGPFFIEACCGQCVPQLQLSIFQQGRSRRSPCPSLLQRLLPTRTQHPRPHQPQHGSGAGDSVEDLSRVVHKPHRAPQTHSGPRPMIKAFRCTKFNTISALHERRRVLRKRHDFIWMATQTRHVRPARARSDAQTSRKRRILPRLRRRRESLARQRHSTTPSSRLWPGRLSSQHSNTVDYPPPPWTIVCVVPYASSQR